MVFLISLLSCVGAFIYFFAFKESNFNSDALLLGFIACIIFFIYGFSIQRSRDDINQQKQEIAELKQQLTAPKNASTDNTTNEDSKKDE